MISSFITLCVLGPAYIFIAYPNLDTIVSEDKNINHRIFALGYIIGTAGNVSLLLLTIMVFIPHVPYYQIGEQTIEIYFLGASFFILFLYLKFFKK
jgi:hypothetical protein